MGGIVKRQILSRAKKFREWGAMIANILKITWHIEEALLMSSNRGKNKYIFCLPIYSVMQL